MQYCRRTLCAIVEKPRCVEAIEVGTDPACYSSMVWQYSITASEIVLQYWGTLNTKFSPMHVIGENLLSEIFHLV